MITLGFGSRPCEKVSLWLYMVLQIDEGISETDVSTGPMRDDQNRKNTTGIDSEREQMKPWGKWDNEKHPEP